MSLAKVTVIRAFKVGDEWHMPQSEPTLNADEARELEAKGYCEILNIDGKLAVWQPCCCGGDHSHG